MTLSRHSNRVPDPALFEPPQGNAPMTLSEQFLRHAAECELMSEFTPNLENKEVWKRMAARWIRCAELYESQSAAVVVARSEKRHRTPKQLTH
jgi:hypothetical protein